MSAYKHILVGLDLSEESVDVLQQAAKIAQDCGAAISVAHIVEPFAYDFGGGMPIDLTNAQKIVEEQAKSRLAKVTKENQINPQEQVVSVGSIADELHRLAEAHSADLIVVGSHGRHGLALLFGSAASGVLHGAQCDVLAVRVATRNTASKST